MHRSARKQLYEFLVEAFDSGELRRMLHFLPDGRAIERALPGATASCVEVAYATVELLDRHGALVGGAFWQVLLEARPIRRDAIEALRVAFAQCRDAGDRTPVIAARRPQRATLVPQAARAALMRLREETVRELASATMRDVTRGSEDVMQAFGARTLGALVAGSVGRSLAGTIVRSGASARKQRSAETERVAALRLVDACASILEQCDDPLATRWRLRLLKLRQFKRPQTIRGHTLILLDELLKLSTGAKPS